jgi:hypothetical protein
MKLNIEIIDDSQDSGGFNARALCKIEWTNFPAFHLPSPQVLAEQPQSVRAYESALCRWIEDGHFSCDFDNSIKAEQLKEIKKFIQMYKNDIKHNLTPIPEEYEEEKTLTGVIVSRLLSEIDDFFPRLSVCSKISDSGEFIDQNGLPVILKAKNPKYARIMRRIYSNLH